MIIVMGSMVVQPGDLERLKGPIAHQIAATRAEAGCDHYSLAHDLFDPTVIRVAERWQDQTAFGAHLVSDQMVQFNIDFRAAEIVRARVHSYHPGGEVKKLIDVNMIDQRVPQNSASRVIVMGSVRLALGEIERVAESMRLQVEATRAENGCEHYSFARDAIEPDLLHIAESWRDDDALSAHFTTPHMATFNAVLTGAKLLGVSVKAYGAAGVRTLMGE
jgi:quinol monooxygenase YgiN